MEDHKKVRRVIERYRRPLTPEQQETFRLARLKGLTRAEAMAAVAVPAAPPVRVSGTPPKHHPTLKLTAADLKMRAALRRLGAHV